MTLGSKFAVRLGHRAERSPDGDEQVGILGVDFVNHRLWIREALIEELHRIPEIVVAPVLPVLDHTVDRNSS